MSDDDEKYDIILFCYSIYSIKPKYRFIKQALEMLVKRLQDGMVAVFHRNGALYLDGLVYYQTASFFTKVVYIANGDKVLDYFTAFVMGFII